MQTKSKKELVKEVAYSLMDLESDELAKLAAQITSREVVPVSDDLFNVGSGEFQPIKEKYFKDDCHSGYTLDGRRLEDGSRIVIKAPDGTDCEVILECYSDMNTKDCIQFSAHYHGISVSVPIRAGYKAKWVDD